MNEYTEEELQIDIDYLVGFGMDKTEAENFIKYLLKQTYKKK